MELLTAVGANIRRYRQSAGMSQEHLAHLSGIGAAHLGNVERGKSNPTLFTLQKIANGLNINIQYLLAGVGGGSENLNEATCRTRKNEECFKNMDAKSQDAVRTIMSCINELTGK